MWFKEFLIFWSLAIVTHVAYDIFFKKKKVVNSEKTKELHEIIMFSIAVKGIKKTKRFRCKVIRSRRFSAENSKRRIPKSMDRLLYYLNKARYNLDICVGIITNKDMITALLKLHYRGVRIRIITDVLMSFDSYGGFRIKNLAKQGVKIRCVKPTTVINHKFCLVDTFGDNNNILPFVMTGSLDWTTQALTVNYENYLVSSQTEFVQQYKDEFEKLWILFEPSK